MKYTYIIESKDEKEFELEMKKILNKEHASLAIFEMQQWLRHKWKYVEFESEEATQLIEDAYEKINEVMIDHNVEID